MHSLSNAVILAFQPLTRKVVIKAPFQIKVKNLPPLPLPPLSSLCTWLHVTADRGHLSRLTQKPRSKSSAGKHLSLADAIMLNVSICITLFPKENGGGGHIHLSCTWQSPLKCQACWGLSQQDGRNLFPTLLWQRMQIARLFPPERGGEWQAGKNAEKKGSVAKKKKKKEEEMSKSS